MMRQDGRIIVNEVESLEAMTKATRQKKTDGSSVPIDISDAKTSQFLDSFWEFTIRELIMSMDYY